jgi:hypothetical protein
MRLLTGDYNGATGAFATAIRQGFPRVRAEPYLAELAFLRGDFATVRDIMRGLRTEGRSRPLQLAAAFLGTGRERDMTVIRQGARADIGLLLEGTFPYVSGGVSSWVNQIIRGFPEYTFALCFIGSRPRGLWRHALRAARQRRASGSPLPAR